MCSVDVSSGSSSSTKKKYQVWTASIRREDDPRPKILVCEYVPETKTIENVREVIKNTPLKKVTKLVNCGNDIVAAIGFDDHLRFASVKDMAFIDDDDNSNDNNDQECHRRAVKFEQQPIDVSRRFRFRFDFARRRRRRRRRRRTTTSENNKSYDDRSSPLRTYDNVCKRSRETRAD